ncbi:exopolysaccharide biosynthesis polyprenyl glycosylphosphotransferase [Pseudofulvibacter geojedonensis]|uniref:Exopolysaccharide biosynthesis polyprenyl glycosylphosphotransferase n=1 Tax=Pseudofulvibacter geojedonensis TaxID=1123758 RepID=A0ABW3I3Z5_9FLAO
MTLKRGRYSGFIRPLLYLIDIAILIAFVYYVHPLRLTSPYFTPFLLVGWLSSSFFTSYYQVYRFTSFVKIAITASKQYLLYSLIYFSYFSFGTTTLQLPKVIYFLLILFTVFFLVKILVYWGLKTYRLKGGSNRNTIILGYNQATKTLEEFFSKRPIYGYKYLGFFTNEDIKERIGNFKDVFTFLSRNNVDDIYCSISEFSQEEIDKLVKYANTHFKTLKFIPDSNQIMSAGFDVDYYDYFPVLKMQELALNKKSNRLLKRAFDILFSLIVILGVLSWLTPLLFILIKLESKGSLFYIKDRNGLDYKTFKCYKFRSLRVNVDDDKLHVDKKDNRITTIGRFLRATSLDELPQFFNVLKGDMSVVGPRPHMLAYNKAYADQVDNVQLMARHLILPGVTGLAQVRGYRGAVNEDSDIIGRVKLDLFYIKNWTILLDLKIILLTVLKLFKGDDKAF